MTTTYLKKFTTLMLFAPILAFAEPTLSLEAAARTPVANDEMVVNLSIAREGPDSASLTDGVLTALNSAIKASKAIPGVDTRLGNVSTQPNWNQNKKIGWTVRGELTLTSKDMKGLSALSSQLSQQMQLDGVTFRLSEARRTVEESKILKEAAANFVAKATAAANAFGYPSYALKQLTLVQAGAAQSPRPMMAMASMSTRAGSAERAPVPFEGGESEVSVTFSGAIDLLK